MSDYMIGIDMAKAGADRTVWNSFYDKIDLENLNFLEISDYIRYAYDNPDILKSWHIYVDKYGPFSAVVALYFDHMEIRACKDDVLKVSKILQDAGVDFLPAYNIYRLIGRQFLMSIDA